MRIFAIGDLHLSFGEMVEKPMDIFGGQWVGHTEKLHKNWTEMIGPDDVVIICGDISWGLRQDEAMADLDWVHSLPGKKLLFKGNHDLWWQSVSKLNKLYEDGTMLFVQNKCVILEVPGDGEDGVEKCRKIAICGTRGWTCPGTEGFGEHDRKIYDREVLRLRMSLDDAKAAGAETIIGVLHYPPTNERHHKSGFTELMTEYGVKNCVYGHLHGKDAFKNGIQGQYNNVEYKLVSLDYLQGRPEEVTI